MALATHRGNPREPQAVPTFAQQALAVFSGDLEATVAAMKEKPKDAAVQAEGCRTLQRAAASEQPETGGRHSGGIEVQIEEIGGLEAVIGAMDAHPQDPTVQEPACGAL